MGFAFASIASADNKKNRLLAMLESPFHKFTHSMGFLSFLKGIFLLKTPRTPKRLCSDSGESKGLLHYVGTLESL